MTAIDNTWSFEGLPRISLVTSDYNIKGLGFYDPDWSRDTEFAYQPGKFTKPDGSPHDSAYKDKQAMVVAFKHPIFGNYPGLRNLTGHFHYKYIVSTSLIRPHDVLRADPETQDIYIFADLSRNPPITVIRGDNTQETLYEITPHLTPEQLARLPKEIKFATKLQEKMYRLESEKFELETKLVITESMAVAAQSSAFLYQEELKGALANHQINLKNYTRLALLTRERVAETIESIEGQYFPNAPWDAKNLGDSTKMLASTQATIRDISSTVKLMGSLTDAQKYQVLMQAVNVVGLDFARKCLRGLEQFDITTPTGMEKFTISKEPSLQELMFHYGKLFENKQISFEDWQKAVTEAVRQDQERRRKAESPNAAVQESRKELVKTIVPEAQVPYAPAR